MVDSINKRVKMAKKSPWRRYNFAYKTEDGGQSEYLAVKAFNDEDADTRAKKRLEERGIPYVFLLRLAGWK